MLDERLSLAASLYDPCDLGADIGTDHGLLPCHLLRSGICRRMILADVSENALSRARAQCLGQPSLYTELRRCTAHALGAFGAGIAVAAAQRAVARETQGKLQGAFHGLMIYLPGSSCFGFSLSETGGLVSGGASGAPAVG